MRRVIVLFCFAVGIFGSPIVESSIGKITGIFEKVVDVDIESFLGIPFAKPPVKDLRFALPETFGAIGEFSATRYPPVCPQRPEKLLWSGKETIDEDCLYLNIYRRRATTNRDGKAVIAVIHGGGYVRGSSSSSSMSPMALAATGDVIVVSFNYRLGILGFADMGGLAPGNLGFHDQRLALQWIQDHIANFGGDPKRVTAIGFSAGSMSLAAQIITPIDNKDLFQAAVLDAGVVASNGFFEDSQSSYTRVKKIAGQIGCPIDSREMLDCLRQASMEELLPLSLNTTGDNGIHFFVATADGKFIPHHVEEYVEKNSAKLRKVRTIIGYAKDEGTAFINTFMVFDAPKLETRDEIFNHCEKLSISYNHRLDLLDEKTRKLISDLYLDQHEGNGLKAVAALQADGIFKCPINKFVRSIARHNDQVFVYEFEKRFRSIIWNFIDPKAFGAFHASPYLNFVGVLLASDEPIDPEDKKFSLNSMEMIADFAKTSNSPTFRGVKWPSFSESGEVMILDEVPRVRRGLSSEKSCRKLFSSSGAYRQKLTKSEL